MAKQIERHNKNNILHCIEREGEISRASVAKLLGLSRTTVSTAVLQLMDSGLVREVPQTGAAMGRGRPGVPLTLTEDCWYAVGGSFIDGDLLFAATDLRGSIVDRLCVPVPDNAPESFLQKLTAGFGEIIARCPGHVLPLLGVGTPGLVNHGDIVHASDMDWKNVSVSQHLQRELGYPSVVVNRHWASCLGEYRFGAGKGIENQIFVGISTGIAASIIVDGRLITGAYHAAGEIGHTVVDPNGPLCSCGRQGCLHAVASENALLTHAALHYRQSPRPACPGDPLWEAIQAGRALTITDLCRAACDDHPVARELMERAALYLGLSIGNLISMFNPQRVILGGSLIDHGGQRFTDDIVDSVHRHISADLSVDVRPWAIGRYAGSLGAALLVLDRKLDLVN